MYQTSTTAASPASPAAPTALAFAHTSDNLGPPTARRRPRRLRPPPRGQRPPAPSRRLHPRRLRPRHPPPASPSCPVVTAEIGDTWIHGAGSDPTKVARYRELHPPPPHLALRRPLVAPDDSRTRGSFSRSLLLVAEHTWGLDTKKHLGDWRTYDPRPFAAARDLPHFRHFAASWSEQRAYLDSALDSLSSTAPRRRGPPPPRRAHPRRPNPADWTTVSPATPAFETTHFRLAFDPTHGAITHLEPIPNQTARPWATPDHPLALLRYDTYGPADYDRWLDQYVLPEMRHEPWVLRDQGKPGLDHSTATRQTWTPTLTSIAHRRDGSATRYLLSMTFPTDASTLAGAPHELTLELTFPDAAPELQLTLQWFAKPACRLPEALWLSFVPPIAPGAAWSLHKLGQWLPATDVVPNGNRRLHAVDTGVAYHDDTSRLLIETLDAPLVAVGSPSLLDFRNDLPDPAEGIHINLFNNLWGTNFPQWFGEDARFRFVIHPGGSPPS